MGPTTVLRFTYASLTTPATVYDYDMATRERELKKRTEVLGSFQSEHYRTRRLWATASDGAAIPYFRPLPAGHAAGRIGAPVSLRLWLLRRGHGIGL